MYFSTSDDPIRLAQQRLGPAHIDLRAWPPVDPPPRTQWKDANVVCDPIVGRSVESTCVIPPGTLIKSERPIAKFLYASHRATRCFHCFARITKNARHGVVPCRNHCQWDLFFCSSQCESAQWTRHHRFVCAFPELDTPDNVDVLLALQVYPNAFGDLVSPSSLSSSSLLEDLTVQQQVALDRVCRLFYVAGSWWRETLVKAVGQIRCNGFGVRFKDEVVGKAVYLGASMLNHACDPNALAFFSEQDAATIQIRTAARAIQKGQPITISYGPLSTRQPSAALRQQELWDKYFFTCTCDACCPPVASKKKKTGIVLCRACDPGRLAPGNPVCPACHHPFDWQKLAMTEGRVEHCLARGELEEALRIQRTIYDDKIAHPIGQTLDQLALLYANQGQFQKSVDYCRQSLAIVSSIFGPTSIEAAEEMFKLCSLLFNAHMPKDAKKQIKETIKVHRMLGLDEQNPEDFNNLQTMLKFVSR